MKKKYPFGGLLNKKRFEWMEKEKKKWLQKLTPQKAISLEESLVFSEFIWEWRKNFSQDNPICLRDSLHKKHENIIR